MQKYVIKITTHNQLLLSLHATNVTILNDVNFELNQIV